MTPLSLNLPNHMSNDCHNGQPMRDTLIITNDLSLSQQNHSTQFWGNLQGAIHPKVVNEYLKDELTLNRVYGPYSIKIPGLHSAD